MKLNITVESKCFKESDPDFHFQIAKDPCRLCYLGKRMTCTAFEFCRWKTHGEIFVKIGVKEVDC